MFDKKKNFLDSNQAGLDLLGYSREELLNMSIPDVDADPRVVLPAHEQLLEGERIINYEHQLNRKDGKVITVLNNSRPIADTNGHVIGMQSTLIDITERKLFAEALRESEEKYRSLVTNIPEITWTTDYEFNTIFISPNIQKELGYTPEEIYKSGESVFPMRIHPENIETVEKAFKELFKKGTMFDVEYRIKRKNGEWFWAHDRSIATYERDGVMYADGIFSNITDRKRAEETLLKAHDELEQRVEERTVELLKTNERLKESEGLFRKLAEGSFEAIVLHEEGVILEANDQ